MTVFEKAFYWFRKRFYTFLIKKYVSVEQRTIESFANVMNIHACQVAFIHGGAREVNAFFNQHGGADKLIQILDENHDIIFSPAYTFSYKAGRVFHHKHSRPDVGWFSVAFGKYATSRSADPIHSLWIRGNLNHEDFDNYNTFSERGLKAYLDSKNATTISIGTERVMLSHLHYLEQKLKLPYRKQVEYKGAVLDAQNNLKEITHNTTENKYVLHLERERLEYDLLREGVLKRYDFGSLKLRIFNNEDFYNFLKKKTDENPFYLFFEQYGK